MKQALPFFLAAFVLALAGQLRATEAQAGRAQAGDEISAPTSESTADVAKELQNPVASLISVPLQNNYDVGLGPNHDGSRYTLNIQPVMPFSLTKDWMLISRTILPFIDQEKVVSLHGGQYGLGDTTQSFFFSPKKPGANGIIWGAGPAFLIPTATDSLLGTEKFGAGPTLVALQQSHGFTYGFLVNHLWSFAGDDHRSPVDATFLQPFVSYTTKSAFTANIDMESSYDWNADQWTIPINLQFSQVVKLGDQLMSIGIGGRSYVERPAGGPDWGARLTLTFLFPEAHP